MSLLAVLCSQIAVFRRKVLLKTPPEIKRHSEKAVIRMVYVNRQGRRNYLLGHRQSTCPG